MKKCKLLAIAISVILLMSACAAEQQATPTPDASEVVMEMLMEELEKKTTTVGQDNAIRSAEDYLDALPFSRVGLIKQLEYEGFSNDDAVFAVDSLDINWNWQAYLSAKDYLEMMPFSRKSLTEQLLYEGFTQEQAETGVKAVGL